MPNNYPYERWYWNDWFAGTAILSIQTKGVWHELLGRMFLDDRNYFIIGTEQELARLVGCDVEQIRAAIDELSKRNIADVTFCYNNVTGLLRIECRRLKKDCIERKRAAEGMRKHREAARSYDDVTDTRARNQYPVTNNQCKENTPKESVFPFEEFWEVYGKKVERMKCERIYARISEADRQIIRDRLPAYVASTPDVTYRKNPQTYLNGRCWNDEIIEHRSRPRPPEQWQGRTQSMEEKDINGEGFFWDDNSGR